MDTIVSHTKHNHSKRIIVSLGAGRCETEMQSKSQHDFCLCLDNDKRALFSAAFCYKFSSRNGRMIFHHYDMSNGLFDLLYVIKKKTFLPVLVLFQHPSPSLDPTSRKRLAVASKDCVMALEKKHVDAIHFVYDQSPLCLKTCWNSHDLQGLVKLECGSEVWKTISISSPTVISMGNIGVIHPIFGDIPRVGWASMKKGNEVAFCIKRK